MTENELITDIHDEITFSGSMPYSLQPKELSRIIKNAEKYFYNYWQNAVETKYLVIPKEVFFSKQFKANRTIDLPECVAFVYDLQRSRGTGSIFGTMDPDFSDRRFIGSELMLSPFTGDNLSYMTVMMSFIDMSRGLMLEKVAYEYNQNTRRITITGKTPVTSAVAKVKKKIEREFLFEDEMFQRYVRAKAKMRLGEMVTNFDFELPGGVKINYQNMMTKASEEFEKVLADIKGENPPIFMLLQNG